MILFRGMTWRTLPCANIYVISDEDNLLVVVALLAGKNKNFNIFCSSSLLLSDKSFIHNYNYTFAMLILLFFFCEEKEKEMDPRDKCRMNNYGK